LQAVIAQGRRDGQQFLLQKVGSPEDGGSLQSPDILS
jgi:hypothetical protein